jgi:hypothetical protein
MVVRQAIMLGLSDFLAAAIASAIAFGSCPSTRTAFQPWAMKRAT